MMKMVLNYININQYWIKTLKNGKYDNIFLKKTTKIVRKPLKNYKNGDKIHKDQLILNKNTQKTVNMIIYYWKKLQKLSENH